MRHSPTSTALSSTPPILDSLSFNLFAPLCERVPFYAVYEAAWVTSAMTNIFNTHLCTHRETPSSRATWVDTEWLGNEAHSLGVSDLTGAEMKREGGEKQEVKRKKKIRARRKRESLFFKKNPFICHLCSSCQALECCRDTGEQRGGRNWERKCLSADGSPWWLLGPRCQLSLCHSMHLTAKW